MTSKSGPWLSLLATLASLQFVGCGNYSNDDLEFMNAVPERSDLSADLPARSALLSTSEAELAKSTHDVVKVFNGALVSVLGLVEAIRAYEPTTRTPNGRIWGPVPADKQPGWQWRFRVERQADQSFDYWFELEPVGAGDAAWITLLTGAFQPSPGIRRGVGSFTLDTAALRAASFPFDVDFVKMQTLTVSYSTKDFPITVVLDLTAFTDLTLSASNSVHYDYGMQSNGQGAMKFTLTGDLIKATAAIEVLAVTSDWLASGSGRATLTVLQGDGAGLMQTECWDDAFDATYNDKPWSPAEDTGDPSACPQIPTL